MDPLMYQLFGNQDSILGLVFQIFWLGFLFVSIFYNQRLQMWNMLRDVGSSMTKLNRMRDEGKKIAISTINEIGKPKEDPTQRVEQFLEYFAIPPINMDPSGVVYKLEHILDVRDTRFKDDVKRIAPEAEETQVNNLENMLSAALALNIMYKVVRHYYLLGKKTKSLYIVMQLQMTLPLIMREAKAYASALRAFKEGQPIGVGAGALVAAKLMSGHKKTKVAKDIVMAKIPLDGRTAYVLKAEGPGGKVGKPGEAIKRIVEENDGKIKTIIVVDAALKLEGEKLGAVADGIGVAIGGPGVEHYKVDEVVLKQNVPVNAVVIKESLGDAVSVMRKEIIDAADVAIKRVRSLIQERTSEGDLLIIAGIGNTVGIGQ
jgi:hypothetical protein